MVAPLPRLGHRPRELRRRVIVRARARTGMQWGDACILNVSSRGLLVQTARPLAEGARVEILRGDQLIIARVMWSQAGRSGLSSDERIPVEEILSAERSHTLQLIASNGVIHDRRITGRAIRRDFRIDGRAVEFIALAAIAASLAVCVLGFVNNALERPLATVTAALGG